MSVGPGEAVPATYTLTSTDHAVYVVVGEVSYGDTTSIINVRFAREDIPEIRLNYPGVISYPLTAGETNGIFSCLHSASSHTLIPDSRLDITLTDTNGEDFYQYTYEGAVSAEMMGVAEGFMPERDYHTFTLHAALYQGDSLVEEASLTYDCKELTDGPCEEADTTTAIDAEMDSPTNIIIMITIVLLILITIGFVLRRVLMPKHFLSSFVVLILSGVLLGAIAPGPHVPEAEAQWWGWFSNNDKFTEIFPVQDNNKSTSKATVSGTGSSITASDTYSGNLSRRKNAGPESKRVHNALQSPSATVRYHANMKHVGSNKTLNDGEVVLVGDVIEFTPTRGEIEWFGTGQYSDSPRGVWYQNAAFPKTILTNFRIDDADDKEYESAAHPPFRVNSSVSIPFSVHPAPMTVTVSGTAGLQPAGTNRYTVTSPGTIEAMYTYNSTYGHYYFGRGRGSNVEYPGTQPMRTQGSNEQAYQANFGERTLTRNLVAETLVPAGNQSPASTTINGPVEGLTGTSYDFSVTGTDPDGDGVYYEIDWTDDGVMNLRSPQSGTVPSGESVTVSRTWGTPGTKTFWARAVDEYGTQSAWVNHTITIEDPVPTDVTLEAQVDAGNWSASDRTVIDSSDIRLRWSSENATSCISSEFTTNNNVENQAGVLVTTPTPGTAQDYEITCDGPQGTATDYLRITVSDSAQPEVLLETRVDDGSFDDTDKIVNETQQVELRWESTQAVSCSGGTNLPGLTGTSGTISNVSLPQAGNTMTYDVYCENSAGDTATDEIKVSTVGPVTALLEASINDGAPVIGTRQVEEGDDVELVWTSSNADRCVGTNFTTGNATSNSEGVDVTVPADSSETYTLTCARDLDGAVESSSITLNTPDATVASGNGPILSADPRVVPPGGDTTVSWDLDGNTGCTYIDQDGVEQIAEDAPNNQTLIEDIASQYTFTVQCDGGIESSISITMLPNIFES